MLKQFTDAKRTAIIACASAGAAGSIVLAFFVRQPLLVAVPFVVGGLAAGVLARRLPSRDSETREAAPVAGHATETLAERRARQERIGAEWMSMRAQVVSGLVGLTCLFVGVPAGVMVAAGLYDIALPIGMAFLALLWMHWRAGWRFHRTIPGVTGVSTTWPLGSPSPADRRFLIVLGSTAVLWFVVLECLALAAGWLDQSWIMVGIFGVCAAALFPYARRHRRAG